MAYQLQSEQMWHCTKLEFSIQDFFKKWDQIHKIWSHVLKKSQIENFIFLQNANITQNKVISCSMKNEEENINN